MRTPPLALGLLLSVAPLCAQQTPSPQPDAAAIMARVAANQDRSDAERSHYIYLQHARVISRKGSTVRCEEITDARVIPTAKGSAQKFLKVDGRLLVKHHYITYTQLPDPKADDTTKPDKDDDTLGDPTMDRDLVENMRENLIASKSKDGIGSGLFPLTTEMQADYNYHLLGREPLAGREVFHLTFEPKDKSDFGWKGDAYIDTAAYEPVLVRTRMSRNIPFAVRALLGTSLPGLGFTVSYAPQNASQSDAIWFPVKFGTEFKLHVLFFFHRDIIVDADNRDFEQTHVTSTIHDAPSAAATTSNP